MLSHAVIGQLTILFSSITLELENPVLLQAQTQRNIGGDL